MLVFNNYRTKVSFKFHILKIDHAVIKKCFPYNLKLSLQINMLHIYWFIIGTVFYSQKMALYPWIKRHMKHSLSILLFINFNLCFCHQFDMSWEILCMVGNFIQYHIFIFSESNETNWMILSTVSKSLEIIVNNTSDSKFSILMIILNL